MAELLKGKIVEWDSKRGFGFLKSGDRRIFVHVKDFIERHHPPMKGDRVAFVTGKDTKDRTCAQKVESLSRRSRLKTRHLFQLMGLLILPALAMDAIAVDFYILVGCVVLISGGSWLVYREDKESAQKGAWRIRESTLHLFALAGGWPGAFLAQRKLRHKTAKTSFLFVFWTIVGIHQLIAFDYLNGWRMTKAFGEAIKPVPGANQASGFRKPPSDNGITPME